VKYLEYIIKELSQDSDQEPATKLDTYLYIITFVLLLIIAWV